MEADWEVEIGGGAPVIDALWPGFVDLRSSPERIAEIAEAVAFPPLGRLLLALNAAGSPLWTAKCDLWETDAAEPAGTDASTTHSGVPCALSCYLDLLPLAGLVFAQWEAAEIFCRDWVARLAPLALADCRAELVVREAVAGLVEGFAVTVYLSGHGPDRGKAAEALKNAMTAFAGSIPAAAAPATGASKLQWKSVGE
jgi:hypothetical protein